MALDNDYVVERVRSQFGEAILEADEFRGMLAIRVQPDALPDVAVFLRDDPELRYLMLTGVAGVDYLGREPRFEVVYHFTAPEHPHRLTLKVGVPEEHPHLPSISRLFPTA